MEIASSFWHTSHGLDSKLVSHNFCIFLKWLQYTFECRENDLKCSFRMDSAILREGAQHGMLMNEVSGSRCTVGNLEGVIFEITLQ